MRTFASAQLLAATLAVNLNINAYDATNETTLEFNLEDVDVETIDWEAVKDLTDEEWEAVLEELEALDSDE